METFGFIEFTHKNLFYTSNFVVHIDCVVFTLCKAELQTWDLKADKLSWIMKNIKETLHTDSCWQNKHQKDKIQIRVTAEGFRANVSDSFCFCGGEGQRAEVGAPPSAGRGLQGPWFGGLVVWAVRRVFGGCLGGGLCVGAGRGLLWWSGAILINFCLLSPRCLAYFTWVFSFLPLSPSTSQRKYCTFYFTPFIWQL